MTRRGRWWSFAGVAAVLAAGAPSAQAAALYPDLKTLPPRDLKLARVDVSADGSGVMHNVLRFSNTVHNVGQGKLVLRAVIDSRTQSGATEQRVYDENGTFTSYPAGSMYYHDVHSHYHYDNWGRYELWTKAEYDAWVASGRKTGQARKVGTKTTSCVMDEEFISNLPSTPWPAAYPASGCLPNSQGVINEGLSVGWGDTYDYYRYEQWVDLGQEVLADGQYVLRSVTDQFNQIYESAGKADTARESQLDNEATTLFTISGGAILDGHAPSGTVSINHVDTVTSTPGVTVSILGRDDVSGVDQVRLSNDGVTWKTYSYTGSGSTAQNIPWSLADPAYGGTAASGTKTIYAQSRDRTGKWSATFTDTIRLEADSSVYVDSVTSDAPAAYWRLGESSGTTASDRTGANGGTYVNGPVLGTPGLLGSETTTAASFDGVNDHVRAASSTSLSPTAAVSVEAWINPGVVAATGFQSVLTKPESYALQFNNGRLEFTTIQGGVRRRTQAPAGAVVAGTRYHVVGTYDGATQRLFLNGTQVASTNPTGAITANANGVYLASWSGGSEFYKGVIDEAAVYRTALPATRVQAHHAAGTGSAPVQQYALTVSTAGTGSGTVTSQPAGIACPPTCTATYDAGALIVLTATPSSTSSFTGWSGACTGAGSCQVTMSQARSVTATFGTSTYATAVTADRPVGFWRLAETSGTKAVDSAATPHDGTYANAPTLGVPGLIGSDTPNTAVRLDGTNDYIRVPNHPGKSPSGVVTLEAWITPEAIPAAGSWASVFSKAESYSLQFNGPRLEFTIIQSGVRRRLLAPSGAVVAGQRYHVVGVYDGVNQMLYLNGALVASRAQSGPITQNNNFVYIGTWNGSTEFLKGVVDEVAIYSGPLSADRIKAHYDTAQQP